MCCRYACDFGALRAGHSLSNFGKTVGFILLLKTSQAILPATLAHCIPYVDVLCRMTLSTSLCNGHGWVHAWSRSLWWLHWPLSCWRCIAARAPELHCRVACSAHCRPQAVCCSVAVSGACTSSACRLLSRVRPLTFLFCTARFRRCQACWQPALWCTP